MIANKTETVMNMIIVMILMSGDLSGFQCRFSRRKYLLKIIKC